MPRPRNRTSNTSPDADLRRAREHSTANPVMTARILPAGGSRKEARQTRSREMVEAILEAAARILESEGYLAASTNAIARRAGVSVGSLYQYFSSREDVFRTLAARHREGIHPLVRNALERLGDPAIAPEKVLSGLLADLLEAHARRPALMHALDSELGQIHTPEMLHAEQEGAAAATRLLAGRIPGPPESALASAWLAAEITATVSRKLAHDPPPWLDLDAAQAAFTRAMLALTRGIGR